METTESYDDLVEKALKPFRLGTKEGYQEALALFLALPQTPSLKNNVRVLSNILSCYDGIDEPPPWATLQALAKDYLLLLTDLEALSFSTSPSESFFATLARHAFQKPGAIPSAFLKDGYLSLPPRFQDAFLKGLLSAFNHEATRYDSQGHEQRALALGRFYLDLTDIEPGEPKRLLSRIEIRNRLADLLTFHFPPSRESFESTKQAILLLEATLADDPKNLFAKTLKKTIEEREAFRLQIDRFWHDTHNRIAPIKQNLSSLLAMEHPSAVKKPLQAIANDIGMIDISLRLSDAFQGSSQTKPPPPSLYIQGDLVSFCQEIVAQSDIPPSAVTSHGSKTTHPYAPSYLRFALQQLIANSLEAYQRRKLSLPSPPFFAHVDYDQASILFTDKAGGISPQIRDPFALYASEKGVHMKAGLGLYQARQALEAIGGSLDLAPSQPPGGAAFLILLEPS